MRFGAMVIKANEPLGSFIGFGQGYGCRGEQNRSAVHTGLRIETECLTEGRTDPAQVAESAQIKVEPGIGREQRSQPVDRSGGGKHLGEVCGEAVGVLLESNEEEGLVPAKRPAGGAGWRGGSGGPR